MHIMPPAPAGFNAGPQLTINSAARGARSNPYGPQRTPQQLSPMAAYSVQGSFHGAQPVAVPLPTGWQEARTPQGVPYYYNTATGASTYERPTETTPRAHAPVAMAPVSSSSNGATTNLWIEYKDESSGQAYYYNTVTKACMWEEPEEYRMQKAREEVESMQVDTKTQSEAEEKALTRKKRETEEKAKKYENLSREERVALFKAFLEEKEMEQYSRWQEAQRVVAKEGWENDPRWKFALSTVGEKKQTFAEYCTQAINRQKIEKRRQVKKTREEFMALLTQYGSMIVPGALKRSKDLMAAWSDVLENPMLETMRKDSRWLAIDETSERKNLFEGFIQDAIREQQQNVAKRREEFKAAFLELLREKTAAKELVFRSKSRGLDSDAKKAVLQLVDQIEAAKPELGDAHDIVEKYDIYTWTEDLAREVRAEESKLRKAEREKQKHREAALVVDFEKRAVELVTSKKMTAGSSWEDFVAMMKTEEAGDSIREDSEQVVSERAQRRVFEKKLADLREALKPAEAAVRGYLKIANAFQVTDTCSYDHFTEVLTSGIHAALDEKEPEDGEEAESEGATEENGSAAVDSAASRQKAHERQLEELIRQYEDADDSEKLVFPDFVRAVFEMLVALARENKARHLQHVTVSPVEFVKPKKESSRSRKRRRTISSTSSPQVPVIGRSRSRSIARQRSRSPSHRNKRSHSRHASRSRSAGSSKRRAQAKLAQALPIPSLAEEPLDHTMAASQAAAVVTLTRHASEIDESAKAEAIIREARQKLLAKQAAKSAESDESELEEGEEAEDRSTEF